MRLEELDGQDQAASYLRQITSALGLPPTYFHHGDPDAASGDGRDAEFEALSAAFAALDDPAARRLLIEVAQGLAASSIRSK